MDMKRYYFNKNRNKGIIGALIILLFPVLVLNNSVNFIYASSSHDYSNLYLTPVLSSDSVSTTDAKFMNNCIITGVNGKLTILSTDRSVIATFPEIIVNWIYTIDEEGLIVYCNTNKKIGI